MKTAIVTGASGLIGSQTTEFFHNKGYRVIGIDNDMRAYFFGEDSSTKDSNDALLNKFENYIYFNNDIRDYASLEKIFQEYASSIDIVVHTAAQPSHDWAAKEPLTDFSINAMGTMNMLELTRLFAPKALIEYLVDESSPKK